MTRFFRATAAADRLPELDALRGLAALAVTLFHYTTHYGREIGHVSNPSFGFPAGNYGVELFFLISGFVILMTLERTMSAMDFVVSRFGRLFPTYWAAIAITAFILYKVGLPGQHLPLLQVLANLTMVQEILGFEHLDGSYWTLQVELFFYAQMLFWYACGKLDSIRWIIVGWLLVALVFGLVYRITGIWLSYTVGELLIARHLPFFAMGILFYRIHTRPEEAAKDYMLIAASLAVVAVTRPVEYLIAALVSASLFWLFVSRRLLWLRLRPFALLGTISYSLYLLHQAMGYDLLHYLEHAGLSGNSAVSIAVLAMVAASCLMTFLIERPTARALRRAWSRWSTRNHGLDAQNAARFRPNPDSGTAPRPLPEPR